jgi:general secretion pathway protein G
MKSLRHTARAAFTLMEITLVVMIIALLAGLAIYQLGDNIGIAQYTAAKADMRTYKVALLTYRGATGNYPTTAAGLNALVTKPDNAQNWRGPYMESLKKDPWGKDYIYVFPGQKHPTAYDISSAGMDGQPGTSDDVWPD